MNQMHSYRHYYSVGTKWNNRDWGQKETKATKDEQKGIQTISKTFQFDPIPLRSRNTFNKATVKNIYYLIYCFRKKDVGIISGRLEEECTGRKKKKEKLFSREGSGERGPCIRYSRVFTGFSFFY